MLTSFQCEDAWKANTDPEHQWCTNWSGVAEKLNSLLVTRPPVVVPDHSAQMEVHFLIMHREKEHRDSGNHKRANEIAAVWNEWIKLREARAAIEGEGRDSKCQFPVEENSKALIGRWRRAKNLSSDPARAMTYGYCADELEGVVTGLMGLIKLMRESTHPDAMVREQLKAAANLMEEIVGGRAERVLEAAENSDETKR